MKSQSNKLLVLMSVVTFAVVLLVIGFTVLGGFRL